MSAPCDGTLAVTLTVAQLRKLVAEAVGTAVAELEPREQVPALLTTDQICAALQTSRPSLQRQLEAGLPHVMLGDHRRFRLAAVLEWLERRAAERGAA